MPPTNELQTYERLLCGHLDDFVARLRLLPTDKWDWTPNPAAPTPRTLAVHTWQWLVCDRQHISEPNAARHQRIPDAPAEVSEICSFLQSECENWRVLLRDLTAERLDRPSFSFNQPNSRKTVRNFIAHMVQNVIYKHGQFSTLFFAMELDGKGQYTAPFPNAIYEELGLLEASSAVTT